MDLMDFVIDFILKYIVCPWGEISSYSIAVMISSIGILILVFIIISLNKINNFYEECKKLRLFIYIICALILPCFGILLPIYIFIPIVPLLLYEINKKEKEQIEKLYMQYKIDENFTLIYESNKSKLILKISLILIFSIIIICVMDLIGFDYHFAPVLPNI